MFVLNVIAATWIIMWAGGLAIALFQYSNIPAHQKRDSKIVVGAPGVAGFVFACVWLGAQW